MNELFEYRQDLDALHFTEEQKRAIADRAAQAARQAVDFVRACAERTAKAGLPMREGVEFEPLLGLLTPSVEK